jgi:serine/threonine protein kinase
MVVTGQTPSNPSSTPITDSQSLAGLVTFGNYSLILSLGHGGMADVFLAVYSGQASDQFSKLIVIKRLRPNLAEEPEFVQMLVDEARLAARLNHPNVVQTNEIGCVGRQYFIAMEYLEGQPLHRIFYRIYRSKQADQSVIPRNVALTILCGVLAGLHYAHELTDFDGTPFHIVHRDVNPQNVFVTYAGQVKLVDFGIAKAVGRSTETQEGVVKGKVAYMAPEQLGATDVDRRADVFAVGIMLWELLAGERMWKGQADLAIFHRLLAKEIPVSPRERNDDVPEALDAICRKALAPEPSDRYSTAAEFQADLERYLRTENSHATAREIGDYVSAAFEDKRTEVKSIIESQLAQLRVRPALLPELHDGSLPPTVEAIQRELTIHSNDANLARPPGQRRRWALLAGLIAIAVATGFFAFTASRWKPKLEAQTTASASASAAEGAASGTVTVSLRASPTSARIIIDNGPPQANPYVRAVPRGEAPHVVTILAPGYKSYQATISFAADVDIQTALEQDIAPAVEIASTAAPGQKARRGAPAGVAEADRRREGVAEPPTAARADSPREAEATPPTTTRDPARKTPRPLDSALPW